MYRPWLRKQSGQAVVLVAIAVLVLTAILMLALDGGGIYLDQRQIQNAADAAALAGAEKLMAVSLNYSNIHNAAAGNLVSNLAGTTLSGTACSPACANQKIIGAPGGNGVGTLSLGNGYYAELNITSSYTYQVSVWHLHQDAVAPIHGFQSSIYLAARATAENGNLPYAVVLLQDKYAQWSNFNINGTPGSITMKYNGSNPDDRGGMFSNESIAPGNDTPSIIFGPPNLCCGDLWAVNESATDATNLNSGPRVSGELTTNPIPRVASHIDYPNYPEPAPPSTTYNGSTVLTGNTTILCPGQYSNQIVVQNGSTAILYPGVYQVQVNGLSVQGTLRTFTPPPTDSYPQTPCPGLATLSSWGNFDPGVIIEVTPADNGNSQCNKHLFAAGASSTINLTPSPKYFNISLYIETMLNWQTVCTSQPLGTNVVKFSGGACYSIGGAIYGPADNMTITGSGCGTGVGQIVAWTLTLNGNGNLNETYNPASVPYLKGLTQ